MLENWRYNRARRAISEQKGTDWKEIFWQEEYRTQRALENLGIKEDIQPREIEHVDCLLMNPEKIESLRVPYAVEVLGMPCSGKSTMIKRYLKELEEKGERDQVALVEEGVKAIKDKGGKWGIGEDLDNLRKADTFEYSLLAGTTTFANYLQAVRKVFRGARVMIADRGQIDRRVFRRAFFAQGKVNPELMAREEQFMRDLENTPIQIGGVIMLMTRPKVSFEREESPGLITNMEFLPLLYEQYWRVHEELRHNKIPYRVYSCIDAEGDEEKVYEKFREAMGTARNLHDRYLAALQRAFPKAAERARRKREKEGVGPSQAEEILSKILGGNVLIVGGDEMKSKEEIFQRSFIEGVRTKDTDKE